jgi:ATP-dependent RNA helicase DeaD
VHRGPANPEPDVSPAGPAPTGEAGPSFSDLGLSPAVLQAVEQLGFAAASPIQAAAIPAIMAGHDVVGQSETGSGKTAAFCIPAIERIVPDERATQVLILAPTRELAMQISTEARKLGRFKTGLRVATLYGGDSYERQFAELSRGPQIVVGTPGRLVDHLARGTLGLASISLLVLDEADRMLDMGFQEDVEKLFGAAPAARQTVFFSATFSPPVQALVRRQSRDPRMVTIARRPAAGPPLVEQVCHEVRHQAKLAALCRVIEYHDARSGLIFCNTQRMVEELAESLAGRGFAAERLHGGMAQPQRTRVMEGFKRGAFRFLVATDVAARGIDVNDLELVVNYDLPQDGEDYVHRIGRTGRAGRAGRAVTLVSGSASYGLRAIERFTGTPIRRVPVPTAEMVARRRADAIVARLRETLGAGPFPAAAHVVERLVAAGHAPTDVAAAILHHFAPPATVGDELLDAPQEPRRPAGRRPPGRRPPAARPAHGGGPRRPGHPRPIGPGGKKRPAN